MHRPYSLRRPRIGLAPKQSLKVTRCRGSLTGPKSSRRPSIRGQCSGDPNRETYREGAELEVECSGSHPLGRDFQVSEFRLCMCGGCFLAY